MTADREAMTLEQASDLLTEWLPICAGTEATKAWSVVRAYLSRAAEPVAWKPVIGFEEYYEVSSDGDIRSRKSGRILSKPTMGAGYQKASLWVDGKRIQTSVHRVVATAFLGAPHSPGHEVNHINGIKTDNRAANLEWVTRSENEWHSRNVLGNLCQPLTVISIDSGEELHFPSMVEACEALHLTQRGIWACLNGRQHHHKGFVFRRADCFQTHPSEDARDAKRYRWLAEHEDADLYMENPGKDALDAAIDAAMAKENCNGSD